MPKKISDLYADHPVTAFNGTEQIEVNDNGTSGAATVGKLAEYVLGTQNLLRDFAVSLYPDSGRFAGNSAKSTTIGAFEHPSYIVGYNGTTFASAGKFITNNTDYGGSGGNLAPTVKDLIDKIRSASGNYRRYGVEFYVAEYTKGSGTSGSALNIGGVNYYISLIPSAGPMVPRMTFHAYLRAIDAPIVVVCQPGMTLFLDGVPYTTHQLIEPSDGWVSVLIWYEVNPYESVGYQPEVFLIRAANDGNRYQMACPALMGGINKVDINVGVIAGINRWL